jgi:hypothetical protein
VKGSTGFTKDPSLEDFAAAVMSPNHPESGANVLTVGCPSPNPPPSTLGACIGGGFPVAWDAGGNLGSASGQDWNLFGYSGGYLNSCTPLPDPISRNAFGLPFGLREDGAMSIADAGFQAKLTRFALGLGLETVGVCG